MAAFVACLVFAPAAFAGGSSIAPTSWVPYGGRAYGVSIDDTTFGDTGWLSPYGGVLDAGYTSIDTEVAQADSFLSTTMGFDGTAQSEAVTSDVTLLPGTAYEITVDFVRSTSFATADDAWGSSEIQGLTVAGQSIEVSDAPNQVYEIPGVLILVINEQVASYGNVNEITVNALHLWVADLAPPPIPDPPLLGSPVPGAPTGETPTVVLGTRSSGPSPMGSSHEVVVSSSNSSCGEGQPEQKGKDFVTGGGWIRTCESKANFGFVAGYKPGKDYISGNFNYVDHGLKMHVKSESIETYDGEDNWREFSGPATIDGDGGYWFDVYVEDNGEPGRGDFFSLTLSTGYHAEGYLGGGNIQIHG